ncbi:MAG TPA: VWA domain-containing protein [Longimicrobiaceae bacterium]|nr:VWA domain-containing protein [Longimicrobiaceae bacterium]
MRIEFVHPWALLLLLLVPAYLLWLLRTRPPALPLPRAGELTRLQPRGARWLSRFPEIARVLAFVCLAVALARPRTGASVVETTAEGIAIVVAMDISSSMLAEDFRPANRLEVAKRTTMRFVQGRRYDRIGLVAFAGEALTQVPTTIDYPLLLAALQELQAGMLEDGTAIGMGLATAVNRLRGVPGESRVVILLSDGENNRGEIDPRDAARAAAALGIRVYTVGVGSRGVARVPVARGAAGLRYAFLPVRIDEALLTEIARATGGRYFRASDPEALRRVYDEIDRMVRTPVQVRRYVRHTERYLPFLLAGALLLVLEWLVRGSRRGGVP